MRYLPRRATVLTALIAALIVWPLAAARAQFPVRAYILQSAATATGGGTVAHALGYSIVNVQVVIPAGASPTFTVTFEQSLNDVHYAGVFCTPLASTSGPVLTTSAVGQWRCNIAGSLWFRARLSAYTGPGAVTVYGVLMAGGAHTAGVMRPRVDVAVTLP